MTARDAMEGSRKTDVLDAEVQEAVSPDLPKILEILDGDASFAGKIERLAAGERLLDEAEPGKDLFLVLEGRFRLFKTGAQGQLQRFHPLGPGKIIGILSYFTGDPSFFGAEAEEDSRVLRLSFDEFNGLATEQAELHRLLDQRLRDSFTTRYRRMVELHLEREALTESLRKERSELQATVEELKQTRERLVSSEKLAMLGSILPGIAHELNNPVASVVRTTEYLETILRRSFAEAADRSGELWTAGVQAGLVDTRTQREQMAELERDKALANLPKSLLRGVAGLPREQARQVAGLGEAAAIEQALGAFEAGRFLHTLRTSGRRIGRLVESLKRYSRSGIAAEGAVDVTVGLRDTLLILASKLRTMEVDLDFQTSAPVSANEDELNQIWTNILSNAIDSVEGEGTLRLATERRTLEDGREGVEVTIADNGPGVPEALRQKIFEPNFTTKGRGGNFGLGLGLSIARAIIEKYEGQIECLNNSPQGALFRIWLPLHVD